MFKSRQEKIVVSLVLLVVPIFLFIELASVFDSRNNKNSPGSIKENTRSNDEKYNITKQEKELFVVICSDTCSHETKSIILDTANKTLKILEKEFPWIAGPALEAQYYIEVNPTDIDDNRGSRSYVDYEKRTVKLTRIYIPTIAHEISHLLIAEYFSIERSSIWQGLYPKGPAWLQEGMAMYLEYRIDNTRNATDIIMLKNNNTLPSLEEFEQGSGPSLKFWYAQSWSVFDFLIYRGGKKHFELLSLCVKQNLFPGDTGDVWAEKCFNDTYGDIIYDWNGFYQEWIRTIKHNQT